MRTKSPVPVKNIILVDDEVDVLHSLKRDIAPWTERRGLTVQTTSSGEECLELLETQYPETGLVISDLRMPGMNGSDLILRLGRQYPDVGCIMVTAYSDMDQITRAISGSMLGLVQKPWDAFRLTEELDRAVTQVEKRRSTERRNWELSRELEMAGAFQRACMEVPEYNDDRFSFGVLSRPTPGLDVTGDFFDLIRCGRDEYLFTVGDVAGHGVRAALLSGMLRVVTRNYVNTTGTVRPADLLDRMNRALFDFLPQDSDMLVSCVAAVINVETGALSVANAGHPPMFIIRDDIFIDSTVIDVALGALKSTVFRQENFAITPGERIVLYSDGLYERRRERSSVFSRDWIGNVFHSASNNEDFEGSVVNFITAERIIRGASTVPLFEDDLTIASIRLRG